MVMKKLVFLKFFFKDYQLMLVPKLLREKVPDINVAFFLHIPFPSSEIYKILPVHKVKDLKNFFF